MGAFGFFVPLSLCLFVPSFLAPLLAHSLYLINSGWKLKLENLLPMKQTALLLLLAASVTAASAQAPGKSATQAANPATATHSTASAKPAKIPVVHGIIKTAFTLRYEDYKIGTGPLAEPNKLYHVLYTGYLASTGQVFDSSEEHRIPVMKNGKPVMDAEGNPELGPPQPLVFPQGFGRMFPGFDQGFEGMHVGGKRRIFVPWQLALGTRNIPAHGDRPGIPPRSNLIFDVELVDVTDMPAMPARPMPPHPGATPGHPMPGQPAKPATPGAPATPQAAPAPAKPAAPTATTAPSSSTTPPQSH